MLLLLLNGKGKWYHVPMRAVHLPLIGFEPVDGHISKSVTRGQCVDNLPTLRASPPFDWYQVVVLGISSLPEAYVLWCLEACKL